MNSDPKTQSTGTNPLLLKKPDIQKIALENAIEEFFTQIDQFNNATTRQILSMVEDFIFCHSLELQKPELSKNIEAIIAVLLQRNLLNNTAIVLVQKGKNPETFYYFNMFMYTKTIAMGNTSFGQTSQWLTSKEFITQVTTALVARQELKFVQFEGKLES